MQKTYQQLLFGLSAADIVASLACFSSFFLQPRGTTDAPWAFGSKETCAASGFVLVLSSTAAVIYNCFLSIHFWRTIQGSSPQTSSSTTENDGRFLICTHCTAAAIPLILSFVGVVTNSFSPLPFVGICYYYEEYPVGCDKDEEVRCEHKQLASMLGQIRVGFAFFTSLISCSCTLAIYLKVRSTTVKSRHRFDGSLSAAAERRLRSVAIQSLFYTGIYINTFLWPVIGAMVVSFEDDAVERRGEPGLFALQWALWFFLPLQGALNFLVYIRPRYMAWRNHLPDEPFSVVLKQALSADDPPRRRSGALETSGQERSSTFFRGASFFR